MINRYIMKQPSLHKKLMSILIILTIIPVSAIFLFVYIQQSKIIDQTIRNVTSQEFQLLSDHINSVLSQTVETSSRFFLDDDIAELLSWQPESEEDSRKRSDQLELCMRRYSASISSASFYTALLDMNGEAYGTGLLLEGLTYSQMEERPWFSRFSRSSLEIIWVTDEFLNAHFVSPNTSCVYIVRQIKDRQTWETTGLLILAVPSSQLVKVSIGYMQNGQNFYVTSGSNVLAYIDTLNFGRNYIPDHPEMSPIASSSFMTSVNGKRYLVNSSILPRSQWTILTYTDYAAQLHTFAFTKILYFLMVVIYIILAFYLSTSLSKRFLAPIKQLHQSMQSVKKSGLQAQIKVDSCDEIGDLSMQFNDMLKQISVLMENVVQEQEAKRKSEILALQAQINPHFIYNTLATVRYMIYADDKENADLIILALIKILRNAISSQENLNTVEKDLDILKSYISIQQFTVDTPIEVRYDIQDGIKTCYVLKMILQPIVENAILHGLKPKKGKKKLTIKGYRIDEDIEFQIIDNGVGFDTARLSQKPKQPAAHMEIHSNIAINNVTNRLRLYFGDRYGLVIQSAPGRGTCASIRFPYIQEEGFAVYEHIDC